MMTSTGYEKAALEAIVARMNSIPLKKADGSFYELPASQYSKKDFRWQLLTPCGMYVFDNLGWIDSGNAANNFARSFVKWMWRSENLQTGAIKRLREIQAGKFDNLDEADNLWQTAVYTGKTLYRLIFQELKKLDFLPEWAREHPFIFKTDVAYGLLLPGYVIDANDLVCLDKYDIREFAKSFATIYKDAPGNILITHILKAWVGQQNEYYKQYYEKSWLEDQLIIFCHDGDNCGHCHNLACKSRSRDTPPIEERWQIAAEEQPQMEEMEAKLDRIFKEQPKVCEPKFAIEDDEDEDDDAWDGNPGHEPIKLEPKHGIYCRYSSDNI